MLRRAFALAFTLSIGGCAGGEALGPSPSGPSAPRSPGARSAPVAALEPAWIDDDLPGAMARARAEGKVLLVDAWAPWCHTCLSMQREVLHDAALGAYGDRVTFVALDTDRPVNAPFLERFAVEVWPTFFVLDPADDRVLAVHGGAASLSELTGVIDGALALRASGAADPFEEALAAGAQAYATRRFAEAAAAYERAAAIRHPRASEAFLGAIRARFEAEDTPGCARVAEAGIDRVSGAAMAADFSYYARACAAKLEAGPQRASIEASALARLRGLTTDPPPGATVDDRADALGMLAEAEKAAGHAPEAKRAIDARVALLDEAAAAAKSPAEAAVFDYLRMRAYEDAGRPEAAVTMLEERTRQTPESYEPFARLASVLAKTDPPRAIAPLRRAIELSYGPRRLRYLEQEAELLGKLGDGAGRVAALERIVLAHRAMPKGHADPARLAKAEAALAEAKAAPSPSQAPPPAPPTGR